MRTEDHAAFANISCEVQKQNLLNNPVNDGVI